MTGCSTGDGTSPAPNGYRSRRSAKCGGCIGPQNLHGVLRVGNRRFQQGRFICAALSFAIPRPGIPRRRYHTLVVLNFLVFDVHPVTQ
jgi:hypothetical protein